MLVPRTLPELARWARTEPALRRFLDLPCEEAFEELYLSKAMETQLRALCKALGTKTLGDGLEQPAATSTLVSLSGASRATRLISFLGEVLGEQLDRHVALETAVEGEVDRRHAAEAEALAQLVAARDELLAAHGCSSSLSSSDAVSSVAGSPS